VLQLVDAAHVVVVVGVVGVDAIQLASDKQYGRNCSFRDHQNGMEGVSQMNSIGWKLAHRSSAHSEAQGRKTALHFKTGYLGH
jgi:hypothetical protein